MHPKRWLFALGVAVLAAAPLSSQTVTAGQKIPVFATDSERGSQPRVAAGAQGGFLVVWQQSGGKLAVRALDASGTPAVAQSAGTSCEEGLCLNSNRLQVTVSWRVPGSGAHGTGTPIPMSADTGAFWFFQPSNYEIAVKVLDGRALNGHFWVFFASLTNVEFDLKVLDTLTLQERTYHNPAGTLASKADTEAF